MAAEKKGWDEAEIEKVLNEEVKDRLNSGKISAERIPQNQEGSPARNGQNKNPIVGVREMNQYEKPCRFCNQTIKVRYKKMKRILDHSRLSVG